MQENDLFARHIRAQFTDTIWEKFVEGIRTYHLLEPGDRVCVCISGGKDSMLLAKLMQMLEAEGTSDITVRYLIMDPGYNPENREKVEENARLLGIPYTLFESDIFAVANHQEKNPCFLCARMRRGFLYARAQEMGCNKIALGHHFDDVIGTTLLSMFYGGQLQAMLPRLKARNFPGMELIRPLYLVHEEDIIRWRDAMHLTFIQCACRFTEESERRGETHTDSKRLEVKRLLKELRRTHPDVEENLFRSLHHLELDTMVGWKYKGRTYSFLDMYDMRDGKETEA